MKDNDSVPKEKTVPADLAAKIACEAMRNLILAEATYSLDGLAHRLEHEIKLPREHIAASIKTYRWELEHGNFSPGTVHKQLLRQHETNIKPALVSLLDFVDGGHAGYQVTHARSGGDLLLYEVLKRTNEATDSLRVGVRSNDTPAGNFEEVFVLELNRGRSGLRRLLGTSINLRARYQYQVEGSLRNYLAAVADRPHYNGSIGLEALYALPEAVKKGYIRAVRPQTDLLSSEKRIIQTHNT
jgi:hypothetical protein